MNWLLSLSFLMGCHSPREGWKQKSSRLLEDIVSESYFPIQSEVSFPKKSIVLEEEISSNGSLFHKKNAFAYWEKKPFLKGTYFAVDLGNGPILMESMGLDAHGDLDVYYKVQNSSTTVQLNAKIPAKTWQSGKAKGEDLVQWKIRRGHEEERAFGWEDGHKIWQKMTASISNQGASP